MGQPTVGEIRMFAGSFAPAGWAFCDGSLHPISENETLFNLIGTTYGGDGQETFAYPDLQGRVPIHMGTAQSGTTYTLGEKAGVEQVTLTVQQIPAHSHGFLATSSLGAATSPDGAVLAESTTITMFTPTSPTVAMAAGTTGPAGGSQPHDNMQPYLTVSFIISLFGVFPTPS